MPAAPLDTPPPIAARIIHAHDAAMPAIASQLQLRICATAMTTAVTISTWIASAIGFGSFDATSNGVGISTENTHGRKLGSVD